jgi:hypothetical protein
MVTTIDFDFESCERKYLVHRGLTILLLLGATGTGIWAVAQPVSRKSLAVGAGAIASAICGSFLASKLGDAWSEYDDARQRRKDIILDLGIGKEQELKQGNPLQIPMGNFSSGQEVYSLRSGIEADDISRRDIKQVTPPPCPKQGDRYEGMWTYLISPKNIWLLACLGHEQVEIYGQTDKRTVASVIAILQKIFYDRHLFVESDRFEKDSKGDSPKWVPEFFEKGESISDKQTRIYDEPNVDASFKKRLEQNRKEGIRSIVLTDGTEPQTSGLRIFLDSHRAANGELVPSFKGAIAGLGIGDDSGSPIELDPKLTPLYLSQVFPEVGDVKVKPEKPDINPKPSEPSRNPFEKQEDRCRIICEEILSMATPDIGVSYLDLVEKGNKFNEIKTWAKENGHTSVLEETSLDFVNKIFLFLKERGNGKVEDREGNDIDYPTFLGGDFENTMLYFFKL